MSTLKVGIIGAGEISQFHIHILKEIKELEVVAICDVNESRAKATGNLLDVNRSYNNYAEMIAKEKPDVIHVLTPPQFHAQIAIDSMESGCHVIVEKPMALSHEDALKMADTAKRTGKYLSVCEIYHFDPVIIRARKMLEQGVIGDLIYAENYWFTNISPESSAYSFKGSGSGWAHNLPGGVFANFLDHPVYLQREFMGKVNTVNTICKKVGDMPFLGYDELRVNLIGDSKTGYIVSSLNGKPRINFLKLYGTEGIITADMSNLTVIALRNRGLPSFLSKGFNNISQSIELTRDTVNTTLGILRKKIKARQGLRTFIQSFYDRLNSKNTDFDDSLIFNSEKAVDTIRVLGEIWDSIDMGENKNVYERNKIYVNNKVENNNKRKVLVTGAGGFLGSNLVDELLKKDLIVRVIVRKINKHYESNENVEVLYGDIRDPECIENAVDGVDTIYHCASLTTNKGPWQNFVDSNINASKNLLEAAVKFKVKRFVFISSVIVYGFDKMKDKKMISEDDAYGKGLPYYSHYANSKIETEHLMWEYYNNKNLPVVILRPGIIFGPKGKNILKSSKIIFGAKRKALPFIYVKDVVNALVMAGDADNAIGKAYNVVSDEQPTYGEFRKKISRIIGNHSKGFYLPLPVMFISAYALEILFKKKKSDASPPFGVFHYKSLVRNLRYDNSKIKRDLGWIPKYTLDKGIKETFDYFMK